MTIFFNTQYNVNIITMSISVVFDSNRWFHSTEVMEGEYSLTIGAEYD